MRIIVNKSAIIKKFLVQGELDTYQQDKALSNVLNNIGKTGFAKLDVPDAFRQGLKFYLENSGYLYNDKLTPEGQKIAETGNLWKTLLGRFEISILSCDDKQYLWSCNVLTDDYRDRVLTDTTDSINLPDIYTIDGRQYKNFDFGRVRKLVETKNTKIRIVYNYPDRSVSYECDNRKFTNSGNFELLSDDNADTLLESLAGCYDFLTAEDGVLRCYKVTGPVNESILKNILIKKDCHLEPVENESARLEDMTFELSSAEVVDKLFTQYICISSENEYCPKHYLPSLFSDFSSIFNNVCERGTDFSTLFSDALKESTGKAHLRLQACIDLNPESVGNMGKTVEMSGESVSINDLVNKLIGNLKNVRSVSCISKFIPLNIKIARNTGLLAEAIKKNYNVPLTVVTCKWSTRKTTDEKSKAFEEFSKLDSVDLRYVPEADLRTVHDRYYRIDTDAETVWIKMTNELDSLQYDTINPTASTVCRVKELTLIRIDEKNIPEFVKKSMEVRK
jgi:hypothetical protein